MSPAEQPQSTTTPTLMGKYQLGRLLGRGSFAKVYKARSLVDNSIVAIKVIDKQKTVDAAMEPRIMHEISAMRRLHHHPNVLRIDEVLATKSKIYLVMEFASGGELFSKLVRRGKFNESFARYYFQQLVSALHFCHQHGVAHRDMKPQNLLLDKDGNLKISDFGLSALPEHLKNGMLHTACGTPAFTAPEVIARKGYDGFKADAWSCGVILFFLLAGFLPFDDSNVAVLYKKIYQRDYKFPEWISKQAKYVIYRLLDPNPGTRMSLEGVMKTSWFRKSLKSKPESSLFELSSVSRKDAIKGGHDAMNGMNAFDIISLSSGLDLSGLFEPVNKIEKRFTSTASAESILEKVTDIGGKLGYRIERGKGWNLGMGKENFVLMVEVLDIAHSLRLVEVKVVDGAVNFEEIYWGDLKSELQDVVLDWHNDVLGCVRQSLGTNMVAKNLSGAVRTSWDKEGQKNDLEESCHGPRGLLSLDCTHQ